MLGARDYITNDLLNRLDFMNQADGLANGMTRAALFTDRKIKVVSLSSALTIHSLKFGWAMHSSVATKRVPITTPSAHVNHGHVIGG